MIISEAETSFFKRSIQLALEAGEEGNLPIGAVISIDGKIVSEGRNAIWYPQFNPNKHAEIEAFRNMPEDLWKSARNMTLYTTLEPCLMCVGAILLHHIGRVMYGSVDDYGGASLVFGHTPTYFEVELSRIKWIGPAYSEECDKLFLRVMQMVMERRENEN